MAAPLMAGNAEAAASNAVKYGTQAWQAFKARSSVAGKEAAVGIRDGTSRVKEVNKAPKQLISSAGKTAGRNSAGRITIFHRGGGAKRLYRKIDMKRSTTAMGVVERIEYDPNRSSRIALVRWVEGANVHFQRKCKAVEEEFVPPKQIMEPTTTTTRGLFSLASLSRGVNQTKLACSPPARRETYVTVGLQTAMTPESKNIKVAESKKNCVRDVFLSAFSGPRANRETASPVLGGSLNLPRIAVAGAKPPSFASRIREKDTGKRTFSLGEIQKWNLQGKVWANRNKRKAAVSWQGFRWQDALGFNEDANGNKAKPETGHVNLGEGDASKSSS